MNKIPISFCNEISVILFAFKVYGILDKEGDKEMEENDPPKKPARKVKGKKSSKEKPVELSEDQKSENGKSENESNKSDDGENKKSKGAWKEDDVLHFQITDTDDEEEKFSKSQEKKKAKEMKNEEENMENDEK